MSAGSSEAATNGLSLLISEEERQRREQISSTVKSLNSELISSLVENIDTNNVVRIVDVIPEAIGELSEFVHVILHPLHNPQFTAEGLNEVLNNIFPGMELDPASYHIDPAIQEFPDSSLTLGKLVINEDVAEIIQKTETEVVGTIPQSIVNAGLGPEPQVVNKKKVTRTYFFKVFPNPVSATLVGQHKRQVVEGKGIDIFIGKSYTVITQEQIMALKQANGRKFLSLAEPY